MIENMTLIPFACALLPSVVDHPVYAGSFEFMGFTGRRLATPDTATPDELTRTLRPQLFQDKRPDRGCRIERRVVEQPDLE
jgi:hypothetical protein